MMASRWRTITWLVTVAVHALSPVAGVSAEPWRHAYVDALPDEAFAVVHTRGDGTRSRHLPHLRSALARLGQVRWEDPADAERARQHLQAHQEALGVQRMPARPTDGPRR